MPKISEIFSFPALSREEWDVICDFDGTITPFDVTDAVLENFASPEWEDVEQSWMAGELTARQCMEKQICLLDVPVRRLDDFLDAIPLTEGFREFADFCRATRLNLLVISDGMDYVIRRVLTRHQLADLPVVANRLCVRGEGHYSLKFPHGANGCPSGVCKCKVAGSGGKKILLIGDGHSDCCLAGRAAFTLAKQGLALQRHCEDRHYPYLPYVDFFDIVPRFEPLTAYKQGK
ncbi:MAG: MtnX-like HAD-IB family phosphatase [Desulfovibrio sp.]|jgi:2,3-diketo-5-methylthio-1-phosphopentane phosphatase|nr:MtnX-like HAD-IB family phosphatase [Desulfovibrio sp.]